MTARRLALAAAAGLALLAPAAARARAPGRPAEVTALHKATRAAEVELKLPAALSAWPALRDALVEGDTAKLNGFMRRAVAGEAPRTPELRGWRRIDYQVAGATPRLISLIRRDDAFTGGAHPNPSISGVIWDQRTKRKLPLSALFRPGVDMGPLDRALCKAVKAAKAAREGAVPLDGKLWKCPPFSQAQAALAPSTARGKVGGLIVLINPYEVGPYVEGIYRVILPYAAFRRALRPGYAGEFAGEPSAAAEALTEPERGASPRRTRGAGTSAPSRP